MDSDQRQEEKNNIEAKPPRPTTLRFKTEENYSVKLPTYEESQRKYEKFLQSVRKIKNKDELYQEEGVKNNLL